MSDSDGPARCALCLNVRALRRSHLFPKAVYRDMRRNLGPGLTDPIRVDTFGGNACTTSRQATRHLLCGDCEQRICRLGENAVLPDLRRHDGFALRDRRLVDVDVYRPCDPPHDGAPDRDAWTHFALGLIWRGAIAPWGPESVITGYLECFEEPFRAWLHGSGEFPLSTVVEIVVDTDATSPAIGGLNVVENSRFGLERIFQFIVPGCCVRVHVGGYGNRLVHEVFGQALPPILFRKDSFARIGLTALAQASFERTVARGALATTLARRTRSSQSR